MVSSVIEESILGRASTKGYVDYQLYDLFNFADPPHFRIDDYPFGGGSGMVMKPEPIFRAYDDAVKNVKSTSDVRVIFPTPDGEVLTHQKALELSKAEEVVFISGHYKGIDQRIRDSIVTDEISIGDYVVTGGELPSLVILDAMVRLIPGVLNSYESAETDSFAANLLDWEHYTRPENYNGMNVPKVLLSGHHRKIDEWRHDKQINKTRERRPDVWKKYQDSKDKED
jgi:tRNA (guanine37-N1)-methyltransferase